MSNQRTLGIALAVAFGVILSFQAVSSKDRRVEVESFVLRDEEGRIRALLTASEGHVSLQFRDGDEKQGSISVDDRGNSLFSLTGKNGMNGLSIHASDERGSIVLMGDMNNLTLRNEVGASLQMSMLLGWSLMTVSDSDGETTAGFIVDPRGKSIAYGINVRNYLRE